MEQMIKRSQLRGWVWIFSSGVINKGGRSDNFTDFVKSGDFFFFSEKQNNHIYGFPTAINYNNKNSDDYGLKLTSMIYAAHVTPENVLPTNLNIYFE